VNATARALAVVGVVAASLWPALARAAQQPQATVTIRTVPALEGVRLRVDGRTVTTDAQGAARVAVALGSHRLELGVPRKLGAVTRVDAVRWWDGSTSSRRSLSVSSDVEVRIGLALSHLVRLRFQDAGGGPIAPASIDALVLSSGAGTVTLPGTSAGVRGPTAPRWQRHPAGTQWLPSTRLAGGDELVERVAYDVRSVRVGDRTLEALAPRFTPGEADLLTVGVDAHVVHFQAVDALLRGPVEAGVELHLAEGRSVTVGPGEPALVPKGIHEARADGGIPLPAGFAVPGDTRVAPAAVTLADVGIAAVVIAALAAAVAVARRRAGKGSSSERAEEPSGRHVRLHTREGRTIEGWTTASDEDPVLVMTVMRVVDKAGVEQAPSPSDSFLARGRVVSVEDMAVPPSPLAPRRNALRPRSDVGDGEGGSATAS
jgi:hypothetical protein